MSKDFEFFNGLHGFPGNSLENAVGRSIHAENETRRKLKEQQERYELQEALRAKNANKDKSSY